MSNKEKEQEKLTITKGPWAWQKFGNEYFLTGQYGMRPIVLGTLDGKITSLKDGLLKPLDPDHPDAKAIKEVPTLISALKEADELIKTLNKKLYGTESRSFAIQSALEKAGIEDE